MKRTGLKIGLLLAVVAAAFLLPVTTWALALVQWVQSQGSLGAVVYGAFYAVSALVLPGSVLTLGAGFAYGPVWGVAIVSPASMLTAVLAFAIGRWAARDWVAGKVAENDRFAAIDRAVEKNGFKIVLLLRLSPVFPFGLLNYTLGITRVPMGQYAAASFVGMLPGTVLYVYLGSIVTNVAELLSGTRPDAGPWGQVLFWGGLVATAVVTVLVTRVARRELARELGDRSALPGRQDDSEETGPRPVEVVA